MLVLTAFLAGLAGVLLGVWWAPFFAGAGIGLAAGRARAGIPIGGLAGLASWLLPLVAIQVRYGIGPSANSLAAIMGFGHEGAVPVALSLIVGALLGVSGAWVTSAARMLVRPEPR
jgi:hypothetical protein